LRQAVRPALRKYAASERVLTDAQLAGDAAATVIARQDVMLAARQAVDLLHHLSDFAWKKPRILSIECHSPEADLLGIRHCGRAVRQRMA